jgi:hypothetical protein
MIKGLLFIGGLGVASYGAYRYYNSQISILSDSKVVLDSVNLVSQTKKNLTLRFNLKVTNNSEQEFTLKEYDFEILFNNQLIAEVKNSNLNTIINSNGGKTIVSFDLNIKPNQIGLSDILSGLISNRLKSVLSLRGRVVAKKGFITLNTPLNLEHPLNELF